MKNRSLLGFGLIALAIAIAGCCKDSGLEPTPQNCLITGVIDQTGFLSMSFEYDGQGRLTRWEVDPDELYYTFSYAADKVVINSNEFGNLLQVTATLNADGRIEEWVDSDGYEGYCYYDDDGYLIEEEYYSPNYESESWTAYYSVANGNTISRIKEYDDGQVETTAYTYDLALPNKEGLLCFEKDGVLHRGLPFFGQTSRNLLTKEVRTDPNQEQQIWVISYLLDKYDYVVERTIDITYGTFQEQLVQVFHYDCK